MAVGHAWKPAVTARAIIAPPPDKALSSAAQKSGSHLTAPSPARQALVPSTEVHSPSQSNDMFEDEMPDLSDTHPPLTPSRAVSCPVVDPIAGLVDFLQPARIGGKNEATNRRFHNTMNQKAPKGGKNVVKGQYAERLGHLDSLSITRASPGTLYLVDNNC